MSKKAKIKIGDTYQRWIVLKNNPGRKILCSCKDCQISTKYIDYVTLLNGKAKNCGCTQIKNTFSVGYKFGDWTLLEVSTNRRLKCQCICGITKEVDYVLLRDGRSKSCGCTSLTRRIETSLETYQVEHYIQSQECLDKTIAKCGTPNPKMLPQARKKAKQTIKEKYGVSNVFELPEMQKLARKRMLEKYGESNPQRVPEIAMRTAKSQNHSYVKYHWKTKEELVCQGSYEAKVVDFLNKNRTNYAWQPKTFPLEILQTTYRPDCHLLDEDVWVEVKGYKRKLGMSKFAEFSKQYSTELWDKDRLKELGIL